MVIEEAKRRADICKGCKDFIAETHVCNLCGCWLKAKVWMPFATCPKGEWDEGKVQTSTHEGS
jgi:hypothetical protein